jgi:hypothetical protein
MLCLAFGGLLAGHSLAYQLLVPDEHARSIELARSGHGYLGTADAFGAVVAIAALSVLFLGALLRPGREEIASIGRRLAAFQIAAFVSMEILERLSSGEGLGHLAPVLLIGLPVQVIVATAIALLARLLLRAADVVAALSSRPPTWPTLAVAGSTPADVAPRSLAIDGPPPGRAPPCVPVAA